MNRLSSRLAARSGIRQIEAHFRAEAAANAADRAAGKVWNQLLAMLQEKPPPAAAYQHAAEILRRLPHELLATIGNHLDATAKWGHRESTDALTDVLPVEVLQHVAGHKMPVTEAEGDVEFEDLWDSLRGAELTPKQFKKALAKLLFPPPSQERVNEIVFSTGWQQRLAGASATASPQQLAQSIAVGFAAGQTPRQIAKGLRPIVDGHRVEAMRIARTETMRVAHDIQMHAQEPLDDITIGWQVHATLDQNTRPAHRLRNGNIYYKKPKPGQLGLDKMPRPPLEADGSYAWNCRCHLTPVLSPPAHIVNDPRKMAVFQNNAGNVVPDPAVYADWFRKADERRRRLAVGTRRYTLMRNKLGRHPDYAHFVNPRTGELLKMETLKREAPAKRSARVGKVNQIMKRNKEMIRQTKTFGFLPSGNA